MTAAHYSFTNLFAWAEKYNIPEHNFPRDREKLVHMKTLVLVGLGIKFLPKEIALLKNLKTVLLGVCRTHPPISHLFLSICQTS